jgi:alkylhydroperoxidase family enzyme
MRKTNLAALALLFALTGATAGDERPDAPIVPATRPELKRILEGSKRSQPRLPLPPPTQEEIAEAKTRPIAPALGGVINNARMRQLYLPAELIGPNGGWSREPDPAMTLGPTFKTMLFWIVSRANNCYYCMGHQEAKLAADGLAEDRIAALDGAWSDYDPAQRAAFAFTRKLTFEPHQIGDADLEDLRAHYTGTQILEIVMAVSGFNAMNRWTGALAIPQEEHRVYLTPTAPRFVEMISLVAPLDPAAASPPTCAMPARRPALESRAEVEAALAAARSRTPRLPLADEAKAREVMPADWPSGPLPQWARLLATFPKQGVARAVSHRATEENGRLSPRLRAQIEWIAARHDRAWYALGRAERKLKDLGVGPDDIFALGSPDDRFPPAERVAFTFTRKLTVDPALISDADVASLRETYSDIEVAELIHRVTEAALFDRLTEPAGLQLEE